MMSWPPRSMWPVSGTQPTSDGIEQREDAVVVGTVEEQRAVVRARVDRDRRRRRCVRARRRGCRTPPRWRTCRRAAVGRSTVAEPIETSGAGKCGCEIDPARGHLEVGVEPRRLGVKPLCEPKAKATRLEAVRRQRGGEAAGRVGIVADHRVGDLDAGIAARGDRREEVVRPAAPGGRRASPRYRSGSRPSAPCVPSTAFSARPAMLYKPEAAGEDESERWTGAAA